MSDTERNIYTGNVVVQIKLILAVWMMLSPFAFAEDVTLAWDPNSETDLAGYKLYYGNAPRTYGTIINVGNVTTFTVTGLVGVGTYYFAVTAYNTAQQESLYSNEVSQTFAQPPSSRCDVNGDTLTNILDLSALANMVMGKTAVNLMYDLNQDGVINILDMQILSNVILGKRICP